MDLVVVGGGLAGLVAAARASELGRSVTVLEAGSDERYVCNARFSGGVFHIAFTEIKSPPEMLRAAIDRQTYGRADPAQADALAASAGRLVDWLKTQGAQYVRTQVVWQSHILAPPRPIVAGQEWRGRGPDVILRRLIEKIEARGGKVERGTRAQKLIMENGCCCGVEAVTGGQTRKFLARAVLLADGGFQANLELLGRHIAPRPEGVKQRGAATGVGDGLLMATEAGAATSALDRFYGHLLCRDAMTSDKVWPYPELDALATAGILVGPDGRRFVDEGIGGVALANAIARLPDPLSVTVVFDGKIWEGAGRSARIPANPTLATAGGTIHSSPTLAALAAAADIDAAGLAETVSAYNAAAREGRTAALSIPRSTDRFQAMAVASAPFMAIPLCAGITYTMGGIRIDGSARVLKADGTPISGLYAAGSTTGGLEGGERSSYVGGLTKAGVQGLIAAEHVAASIA